MKSLQIVGDSAFGGATYLILKWCEFLLHRGCVVDVLSTDDQTVSELQTIQGIRIIKNIYIPREISIRTDLRASFDLFRLLHGNNYDVVHTYTATPGFIGRLTARLFGVPAIFHHQAAWTISEDSPFRNRLFYTPLEFMATLASTRGICVSHAVAKQSATLHVAPKQKLVTICNGIDPVPFLNVSEFRDPIRSALGVSSDTLVIGIIGRLSAQKDVATVLHAFASLLDRMNKPSLLLIIGDGPEHPALEALARQLNISSRVLFLGFRKDIPHLMGAIDIYVSVSLREGLSISLLEAMAAARPIIVTSIPPNVELIEHNETGLLTDPQSPDQIVNAVARYITEPDLAANCGARARQKVLDNYSIDRMFNETWDLYASFART